MRRLDLETVDSAIAIFVIGKDHIAVAVGIGEHPAVTHKGVAQIERAIGVITPLDKAVDQLSASFGVGFEEVQTADRGVARSPQDVDALQGIELRKVGAHLGNGDAAPGHGLVAVVTTCPLGEGLLEAAVFLEDHAVEQAVAKVVEQPLLLRAGPLVKIESGRRTTLFVFVPHLVQVEIGAGERGLEATVFTRLEEHRAVKDAVAQKVEHHLTLGQGECLKARVVGRRHHAAPLQWPYHVVHRRGAKGFDDAQIDRRVGVEPGAVDEGFKAQRTRHDGLLRRGELCEAGVLGRLASHAPENVFIAVVGTGPLDKAFHHLAPNWRREVDVEPLLVRFTQERVKFVPKVLRHAVFLRAGEAFKAGIGRRRTGIAPVDFAVGIIDSRALHKTRNGFPGLRVEKHRSADKGVAGLVKGQTNAECFANLAFDRQIGVVEEARELDLLVAQRFGDLDLERVVEVGKRHEIGHRHHGQRPLLVQSQRRRAI